MSTERYAQMLAVAQAYNEELAGSQIQLLDPFVEATDIEHDVNYEDVLSLDTSSIMGYVEIPVIDVYLPIYHGTSSTVLEMGIGHLEGSSIPIGGDSTHVVLTGHTGLNRAKLLTDLTALIVGDRVYLHILGDTLAYVVYEIEVVLPKETESLCIVDGEDLVTLVTCTPYGVNTHRLLVHCRRIDYDREDYSEDLIIGNQNIDSPWLKAYKQAILIGLACVAVLMVIGIVTRFLRRCRL